MKLLFDARWINNNSPDGITRYSRELIKELADRDINLTLLVSSKTQLEGLPKLESIITNKPASHKELGQAKRLNEYNFDVVFTPHFIFGGKGRKFKLVRTVHDLIPFNQKSKDAKLAWKLFYSNRYFLKSLLNDCEGVVTVSKAVKKELAKITTKNITVVYNAPVKLLSKKLTLKKEIIYIGRYEDYKNVRVLVEAINKLKDYSLVLAGNCEDAQKQKLISISNNSDQLKFLGKISDAEYGKCLSEAAALALPSLEEGFGLPIIEAMSLGCPVVCSDIEIFREVGDNAALYFDPSSPNDLVENIRKLEISNYRKEIIKKSIANAARFSWNKSASELKSFLYAIQRGGKN
jgi:glycosyltransferase involved in cell wall biosynthesis